jgi:crotonobetainyl-CoA:carnitine CoA-transferase CaiB-like acyl-CoA transferase
MLPLANVRVLDLSRLLPGPFATLALADLGAQVDKLEDLEGGDYLRHMPPHHGAESAMFAALNRNKRSIALDLKHADGKAAFLSMLGRYDVLIEQFRPGVMDRLGIGCATLHEQNPRLIICSLTGYGQTGPLRNAAGHDLNYLARSGLLGLQGPSGQAPQVPAFQVADVGGALWSALGIVTALYERTTTHKGKLLDISMLEANMSFASLAFGNMLAGHPPTRGDDTLSGGISVYGAYPAKDGFVTLAALEPKFWLKFAAAVGIEADLSALLPGPHQVALREKLATLFSSRTRREWEAFARQHDCCIEPVLENDELQHDPQLVARQAFATVATRGGPLTQLNTPLTPRDRAHVEAPKKGEHTRAILREAGLDDQTIEALIVRKIAAE